MESTEPRRGFGTTVLVLLLALAFLVGTALFVYVGSQLLSPGGGRQPAVADLPTPTTLPSPTATLAPTATSQPTATPEATATSAPTKARPTATSGSSGNGDMPQTGVGPVASVGALFLAGIAVGARWLRRRR